MTGPDDAAADLALARRAAEGDGAAFAELLGRHYDRIHRLGWRLLGSAAEAEDLAQDVCAGLGARIRGFRGEAAFATWLYRIVVNAARDAQRRRARGARLVEAYTEVEALERAGAEARAAELDWLRRALAALSPELRETAVLVLDEGLTHAEAGAALGVSGGTVSWRMAEIRKRLATLADRAEDMGA
ncbi:RNA polymerase sigma factor [Paralimibaculum aggregatum]|uniref:RNA polymerase sigma factor n=1 Tax=Paralimibaculum aggregatum TaxID=3036245 RepID=A0ABQ6LMR6_9RHOB|nr:RNA polymerase sigma factor [Limibaculum sp. NKW23]GMG82987.1 RNA polymerase sigma factor [Limibaculum sp. NKW23]